MLLAVVPTLAAALVATVTLSPAPLPSTPGARSARAAVLEVRPAARPTVLRKLSLRGQQVELGQGSFEASAADGPTQPFLLKHTEVVADITGMVATLTVTQQFENPFSVPVEGVYVFPLPDDAAVNELLLTAGGRQIRAQIQKREVARRQYEQAKSEGRRAALLDQERPNIFTQSVANLLPHEAVKVTLTFVAPVHFDDGEFLFDFPMVVGPRYIPGQPLAGQSQGTGTSADSTRVIDASRITPPLERDGRDISVTIHLNAGMAIEAMSSSSHRLLASRTSAQTADIVLDASDRVPNKDLILRWKVSGAERRAALVATGGPGGTFALMVMPPAVEAADDIQPKEMVFLVDTSCSMMGPPLEAAKRAMRSALQQMNPADTFMLIDFASTASAFHDSPLLSTPQNVSRALWYLDSLPAAGGSNQLSGIEKALNLPEDPQRLRVVLLMTDGFIGNEREIFTATERLLGRSRLFALGVGTSVNHYLLSRLSELGRGFYQFIRPDEDPEPAVERFVRRIERPVMTDVEVTWDGVEVRDVLPGRIPDLFDAQPLILLGRNIGVGDATVTVKGRVRGKPVEMKVRVSLPAQATGGRGLPVLWARAQIEEFDRLQHAGERADAIEQITTLGLEHHLVTAYTSLVAVGDERVTNVEPQTVAVPSMPPALTTQPSAQAASKPPPVNLQGYRSAPAKPDPGDDEFDRAFGDPKAAQKAPPATDRWSRRTSYIPPAPGAALEVKDSLRQSDIMEVVMSHRAELARCVNDQHLKEPGVNGKLVMKWVISANGVVIQVWVMSEEFKSTYVAHCIAKLIKTWKFPKARTSGDPVVFPFKF